MIEASALLDAELQRPPGGDHRSERARTNVDNINVDSERPTGTSRQAALRRLLAEVTS